MTRTLISRAIQHGSPRRAIQVVRVAKVLPLLNPAAEKLSPGQLMIRGKKNACVLRLTLPLHEQERSRSSRSEQLETALPDCNRESHSSPHACLSLSPSQWSLHAKAHHD